MVLVFDFCLGLLKLVVDFIVCFVAWVYLVLGCLLTVGFRALLGFAGFVFWFVF